MVDAFPRVTVLPTALGEPRKASLRDLLDDITGRCQRLALQHRQSLPPDRLRDRIRDLARMAGDLFHDRVIEICFLLNQHGTLRYNELRRHLGSVSTRTLALKLAYLQREGIVVRTLYDENPPRVEYQLSASGRQFTQLLFPALIHVAARAPQPAPQPGPDTGPLE